jgi:DNA replication protein DnaC
MTLEPSQPNLLFRLVSLRCERKTPIITSNLAPDDLVARMAAPEIVKALKDRLFHRCTHVAIDGPSYREAQAKKRKSKRTSGGAPEAKP